jgi:hypothetical protein
MSRIVEITLPTAQTDAVVRDIAGLDEVIGIRVQRGGSVEPAGDVVTVTLTNRACRSLIHLLDERGVTRESGAAAAHHVVYCGSTRHVPQR